MLDSLRSKSPNCFLDLNPSSQNLNLENVEWILWNFYTWPKSTTNLYISLKFTSSIHSIKLDRFFVLIVFRFQKQFMPNFRASLSRSSSRMPRVYDSTRPGTNAIVA